MLRLSIYGESDTKFLLSYTNTLDPYGVGRFKLINIVLVTHIQGKYIHSGFFFSFLASDNDDESNDQSASHVNRDTFFYSIPC